MLTISKPLSAVQAQTYHAKEFTAKEQNYWSQQGAAVGEWQGHLAAAIGLAGAVSEDDFARLSQGQHPETAEQLVRQRAAYEYTDPRRQDRQDDGTSRRLGCNLLGAEIGIFDGTGRR